ncbi:tRNA-splicing endonuclease subunit sen54 [Sporothrix bragantina]|uniref:tRNA-splicing endonuclease subunit sen54 n=1 Tax=Sporothrix bragantina TaxID=671064 RepID=A0ABP0C1G2_9PEZI
MAPPAQIQKDSAHLGAHESDSIPGASDETAADSGEVSLPGDDEDSLILTGSCDRSRTNGTDGSTLGDDDNDEDDNDDGAPEAQDYRGFAALIGGGGSKNASSTAPGLSGPMLKRKQQISSQTIRKGEKDFEEHGTRAQRDALEQSRAVMESVLAHTRVHYGSTVAGGSDVIRGWYFPDAWQDALEEEEELENLRNLPPNTGTSAQSNQGRRFAHTRHRVVMVEANRGVMFSSVGAVPGKPRWVEGVSKTEQPKPRPGFNRVWLLPEEALFFMERGSMELYWPLQELETVLDKIGEEGSQSLGDINDNLDLGIPLSLQAAYSLLIGPDTDTPRGRVSLPSYQVYTHLRRAGYQVLRAVKTDPQTPLDTPRSQQQVPPAPTSLLQWLLSFISPPQPSLPSYYRGVDPASPPPPHLPHGPLVQPAASSSKEEEEQEGTSSSDSPFRIVYHVWKAGASSANAGTGSSTAFSKTRPPPADFYLSVADAHATGVPSLEQVTELLALVPPLSAKTHASKRGKQAGTALSTPKPNPAPSTASFPPLPVVYRHIKLGCRCVIIAVVDHGIVNYMRFSDGTFGTDPIWPRFDALVSGRFMTGVNGRAGARKGKGKSGGGKNQKKKENASKSVKRAATASSASKSPTSTLASSTNAPAPKDSKPQAQDGSSSTKSEVDTGASN